VSLGTGKVLQTVVGPFNRNQGAEYLDNLSKVAISNGRSGTVVFLDTAGLGVRKTVGIGLGADLMAYDAAHRELFVDHGGRDSNRGFGAVAVIDAAREELVADISTDFRPAAMASEAAGPRLYLCVPGANQIAVIDRPSRQIVARYTPATAKKPVSVALDEADHRLFVLDRIPARLVVLDTRSGATVASLPTVGECEDVFFDAAHRRLYATGLEGVVYCYSQESADAYSLTARVPVREHAGSSLLIPELNRFVVAVAEHGGNCPELWVYATLP
jgi:DNA-binding beta-propeller fold protein YncE